MKALRPVDEDGAVLVETTWSIMVLIPVTMLMIQLILYVHTVQVVKVAAMDAARAYALTGQVEFARMAAERGATRSLGIVRWGGVRIGTPGCPPGAACVQVWADVPALLPGAAHLLGSGGGFLSSVNVVEMGAYPLGGQE